jgi:hypothetical protein
MTAKKNRPGLRKKGACSLIMKKILVKEYFYADRCTARNFFFLKKKAAAAISIVKES